QLRYSELYTRRSCLRSLNNRRCKCFCSIRSHYVSNWSFFYSTSGQLFSLGFCSKIPPRTAVRSRVLELPFWINYELRDARQALIPTIMGFEIFIKTCYLVWLML